MKDLKPNVIDRLVEYIDPIKGRERMKARAMMSLAGSYIGAQYGRRATSAWQTGSGSADQDTLYDLPTLRSRSRDLCRNAPLALGAINTATTSVVGTGLKLQSRIDRDFLGMSEAESDAWQTNTEREFRLWCESKECDAARTLDFYSMQSLVFRSALESGDCFALLPIIERKGSPYGTKVQLIEADRVTNKDNARDTNTIAGGVQMDTNGAPVAYHVLKSHPGGFNPKKEWITVAAFGGKTNRRNIVHLFDPRRPGQTRGVPYLAPVIEPLKQLDRYTEAEIMAAVISGMFTVFVKTEGDGVAPFAGGNGVATDDDYKMSNGAILDLAPGQDVSFADPKRPNTAFDPFVMAVLRQIGVALELPFEVLIKHFTASYSAARAALLEAWRFFYGRRAWLSRNFCQPIYETWMEEAILLGRIDAPGFFDDHAIRKAYLGSEWIGDTAGQIDPVKEVEAAAKRLELGLSTIAEETIAITGGDFDRNYPQIVKERRLMREAGDVVEQKPAPPNKQNPDLPEPA